MNSQQPPEKKGFFEGAFNAVKGLFVTEGPEEVATAVLAGGGSRSRSRSRSKKGKMPPALKAEENYFKDPGAAGAPVQVVGLPKSVTRGKTEFKPPNMRGGGRSRRNRRTNRRRNRN